MFFQGARSGQFLLRSNSAEVNISQISLAKCYRTRSENFEFGVNYWLQCALTWNLLHKPCGLAENFESGKWRCVAHKILPYYFFESNVFERDTLLPYLFCIYHCFVSRDLDVGWIKRVKVFHTTAYFKCVFAGSGCLSEGYWIPYSTHGCRVCQLLYQRSDADLDSWVSEPWRRNEKDCVEGKTAKEFLFFLKSGWLVNILQKWSTNLTLRTLLKTQVQDNKTENQVVSLRMFSSWLISFWFVWFAGSEAVLCHGWCWTAVHQRWDFTRFLQTFLAAQDGIG